MRIHELLKLKLVSDFHITVFRGFLDGDLGVGIEHFFNDGLYPKDPDVPGFPLQYNLDIECGAVVFLIGRLQGFFQSFNEKLRFDTPFSFYLAYGAH